MLVLSQKRCDILSQKHLRCKKSEAKKVQVTEQLKGVELLWGQEEKDIPATLCRIPAYKAS